MTEALTATIPENLRDAVEALWDYHDMHHELRPSDVGIGLGSHDLSVATCAAELWHQGMFPLIVFRARTPPPPSNASRAAKPFTTESTPSGLGVPADAILIEPTRGTPARTSP